VAFELEVISKKVDRFGWDRDRNTPAQDRLLIDWMDALQDYPVDEVRAACRMHTQEKPNKVPNEGHIKAIIIRERGRVAASQPKPVQPDPPRPSPTPEQKAKADELVAQFARRAAQ
jgi:hypothetical protein